MKKFVFVVLCLSVSLSLSAQDIIHKSDGTQIQAEVLSLDDNGVSYQILELRTVPYITWITLSLFLWISLRLRKCRCLE